MCLQYRQVRRLTSQISDVNIISHNPSKRNVDDQLKTIREEKHKEYLHNTGHKSLSLENNQKNKENSNNAIIFKTEMYTKTKQSKKAIRLLGQRVPILLSVILWKTVLTKNGCLRSMVTLLFFTFQEQELKTSIST